MAPPYGTVDSQPLRRSPRLKQSNYNYTTVAPRRINAEVPNKSKTQTSQEDSIKSLEEDEKQAPTPQRSVANRLDSGHFLVLESRPFNQGPGPFGYCNNPKCPMLSDDQLQYPIQSQYRLRLSSTPLGCHESDDRYVKVTRHEHRSFNSNQTDWLDSSPILERDHYYHIRCVEAHVSETIGEQLTTYALTGQLITDPNDSFLSPAHQPINDWFMHGGRIRAFEQYKRWCKTCQGVTFADADIDIGKIGTHEEWLSIAARTSQMLLGSH